MFEKRDDAGHCIRAEEFCGEEAMQVYTLSVCIWPEPPGTCNFFLKHGEVNTHYVSRETACLLPTLAICTPLQQSSQGPSENKMLGAKTSDTEEPLGACSTRVLWFPRLENQVVIYDLQGCH